MTDRQTNNQTETERETETKRDRESQETKDRTETKITRQKNNKKDVSHVIKDSHGDKQDLGPLSWRPTTVK